MIRRARTIAWAAAMAVTAWACATSRPPPERVPARSALPGLSGRECRYAMQPDVTPSLSELARVGIRGNIALWGRGMGPADSVELSIRYAPDEQLYWVEALRSTVSEERVRALEDLLFEALEEFGEPDTGVRVLVVAGDVAAVEPSVICEPEWVPNSTVWAAIPISPEVYRDYYTVRGRQFPVQVTLDELGRIRNVRLLRQTPSHAIDQFILDYVRSSSFRPKLHDGIGVTATFEFRLRFPRR